MLLEAGEGVVRPSEAVGVDKTKERTCLPLLGCKARRQETVRLTSAVRFVVFSGWRPDQDLIFCKSPCS